MYRNLVMNMFQEYIFDRQNYDYSTKNDAQKIIKYRVL